jgi:hypothetical protein
MGRPNERTSKGPREVAGRQAAFFSQNCNGDIARQIRLHFGENSATPLPGMLSDSLGIDGAADDAAQQEGTPDRVGEDRANRPIPPSCH